MNVILKFKHKFLRYLTTTRKFFESNITSYTYLFFTQSLIIALNIVWQYELSTDFGKASMYTFMGKFRFYEVIISYILPLIFFIAFWTTSKLPKDKNDKISFVALNVAISLYVIFSALLSIENFN